MDYVEKLRALKQRVGDGIFVMAISYILSKGIDKIIDLTDDEISSIPGNGFMTDDFCQELVRTAREITHIAEGVQIIQFCQIDDTFDVKPYKPVDYWALVDVINALPDNLRANALECLDLCEDDDEVVSDGYIVKKV